MENMKRYKIHPFNNLPWMINMKNGQERFREFVENIKKNGVVKPVVLKDGMILSGKNRALGAWFAGVECPFEKFEKISGGLSEKEFIVVEDFMRRDMDNSILRTSLLLELLSRPEEENEKEVNESEDKELAKNKVIARIFKENDKIAEIGGVSVATVEKVRIIKKKAKKNPELAKKFEQSKNSRGRGRPNVEALYKEAIGKRDSPTKTLDMDVYKKLKINSKKIESGIVCPKCGHKFDL